MLFRSIGSIPAAPAPSGRSAAMIALNTASSANDLASNFACPMIAMSIKNAIGVANQKKISGLSFEFIKGQKKPRALKVDVASKAKYLNAVNLKISEVLIR